MATTADTELLTEHFGYPPVSLLDDIINSVNILAERALTSVEQALLRQPASSLGFRPPKRGGPKDAAAVAAAQEVAEEARRHEVENGTHQLETLLCASIDRNFDKFELYVMRNILCVRPQDRDWVTLAHYEGLEFGGGEEDQDADGEASLLHLHRRLQASLQLGSLLDAEAARNEMLLAQLRALTGPTATTGIKSEPQEQDPAHEPSPAAAAASLSFLLQPGPLHESDATAPLTTTTAFALSQLPALRQLSGQLRQMAPELGGSSEPDAAGDNNDKSWRRERLEYIEGATRRHLRAVRGLDLGRNGETRDGGSSGSGREVAVQPEALTNILGILKANHGGGAAADDAEAVPDTDVMDQS